MRVQYSTSTQRLGRITSGVKLINLDEGIKVATIAKVRKQPADEDGKDAEGFEEDTDKTVEAIENLSDEEISLFLHKKWIDPIIKGIDETLTEVLSAFETKVLALGKKYAVSYKQLKEDLEKSQKELSGLIGELTGDEFAILGLNELINDGKE